MKTILVVDDDDVMRTMLDAALTKAGFIIIEAADGMTGLQLAQNQLPDLIVSDIYMPNITGVEMLATLRSNPLTSIIPVILMTSKSDPAVMRAGMLSGADDYLPKPFEMSDLIDTLHARLRRQEQIRVRFEAKAEALRANLSNTLPHELLTPLVGILGSADILTTDIDHLQPREILEIAGNINAGGRRLMRVMHSFLRFTDVQFKLFDLAQGKTFHPQAVSSILEILEPVARECARTAARPDDLHLNLEDGQIAISDDYLRTIGSELIANAFKFSPARTPVQVTSLRNDSGWILQVRDHGHGMTPEQIAKIGAYVQFDRQFYEQQGLGLGLALVKGILELHQGYLRLNSVPNRGTLAEVHLPNP